MDPLWSATFLLAEGLPATALCMRSVVHASHAATRHRRVGSLFLWPLGDHRFGSNQETCDRGSTLQSIAHHLRWIDDTLAREIPIFAINAGEDGSVVVGKILDRATYAFGYNAQTGLSRSAARRRSRLRSARIGWRM